MTFNRTSIVFFALALVSLLWGFRKPTWDLFSPGRLYNVLWLAGIGVTSLNWSDLQWDWTSRTWFYILSSIGAFQLGNFLGRRHMQTRHSFHEQHAQKVSPGDFLFLKSRRSLVGLLAVALVWFAAVQYRSYTTGGLPIFAGNTEMARVSFISPVGPFSWKIVTQLCLLTGSVLVLSFLSLLHGKHLSTGRLLLICLLLLSALVFPALILSRGQIVFPAIVCTILFNYCRRRIKIRELLWVGGVFLAVIVGVPLYRHLSSAHFGADYTYTIARMNIPQEYALLTQPYSMIALSMNNLIELFEEPLHWTYGLLTLRPFWTLLGIKSEWLHGVQLPFEYGVGFNTATYLFPFYYDFGYWGLVALPFLFGAVSGYLYERTLRAKVGALIGYSFVAAGICLGLLDNVFVFMQFWLNLGAVYFVVRYGQKLGREASTASADRVRVRQPALFGRV